MAGVGPAPKDVEQRRNRVAPSRGEWVDLPAGNGVVPEIPEGDWPSRAVESWRLWWSDPAASQWTEAQFSDVVELLAITSEFWSGNTVRAAEMRLRADGLGLTQKGKRDLRWRVKRDEDAPVRVAKPAAARRARLKVV